MCHKVKTTLFLLGRIWFPLPHFPTVPAPSWSHSLPSFIGLLLRSFFLSPFFLVFTQKTVVESVLWGHWQELKAWVEAAPEKSAPPYSMSAGVAKRLALLSPPPVLSPEHPALALKCMPFPWLSWSSLGVCMQWLFLQILWLLDFLGWKGRHSWRWVRWLQWAIPWPWICRFSHLAWGLVYFF